MNDIVTAAPAAPVTPPTPVPANTPPAPVPVSEAVSAVVNPPPTVETKVEETAKAPPPTTLLTEPPKEPVKEPPKEPVKEPTATPKAEAAPEPPAESVVEYQPFKLPEGFEVDQKDMGDFTNVLKEFKAPQDLGQKLMDLYAREMEKVTKLQQEQWTKTLDAWKNDVLADPEIGGNRFQTVLRQCGSVLNEFATPEFRQMLDVSGLGNHIEMFKFLKKVADFVGEPKPVVADRPAPQPKPSRAQRRYGRANGASPSV